MRQNNQVELNLSTGGKGEAPSPAAQETEARAAKACLERPAVAGPLMEAVVERENLKKALAQVKRNKGAPGIDGMTVEPATRRQLQTAAGAARRNTEGVGRHEAAGHSDGARPLHSASGDAGAASGLGA